MKTSKKQMQTKHLKWNSIQDSTFVLLKNLVKKWELILKTMLNKVSKKQFFNSEI